LPNLHRDHGKALGWALVARDVLAAALGIDPPAPDAMLGAMAALPLGGVPDPAGAEELGRQLEQEDGIQIPIGAWPAPAARADEGERRILIRSSAQRYNEPADYERLAEALLRRVGTQAGATR
jgi:isopenicillin-N epimerase